jgi:hypothetical protein
VTTPVCLHKPGLRSVTGSSCNPDARHKASHDGFRGLWAPASAGASPLTVAQMLHLHNSAVQHREVCSGEMLFATRGDLLPLLPLFEAYAGQYEHRVFVCEKLRREEPVHEGGDALPPMFWARWVPEIGKGEYILDPMVLSARLLPDFQEHEHGEKLTFACALRKAWQAHFVCSDRLHRRLPQYRSAEELEQLCFLLVLEVKFLAGCDVPWRKSAPSPVEPAGNTAQPQAYCSFGRTPPPAASAGAVGTTGSDSDLSPSLLELMEMSPRVLEGMEKACQMQSQSCRWC